MPLEIERKFLVTGTAWKERVSSTQTIQQGYLCAEVERSVRVRVTDDRAWVTIKGASQGSIRAEFEYPIPVEDGRELIRTLCLPGTIEKTRYRVEDRGLYWEIDEFFGLNSGLVVAEIELETENQTIALPAWIGQEVTHDPRYLNANLVRHPYSEWSPKKT